jgi:hypothetical protein
MPHEYTYEGMIARVGDFAAGANRARGWKRRAAKTLALAVAMTLLLPSVWVALQLVAKLVN